MESTTIKNTAAMLHLSAMSQYIIPFGNFILPLVIWSSQKDKSDYIDIQGKQAINFQLSLFLYSLVLLLIAIPVLVVTVFKHLTVNSLMHHENWVIQDFNMANMTGMVGLAATAIFIFGCLKVAEFFLIIYACVQTSNGENFKYPLTIPFLK